ncbi:MAG TPA: SIMPL domain-containing protein [Phycisphaerae bacterium]|nr:SIMPL domain-containing protein [Phycisphaerae bacterium]
MESKEAVRTGGGNRLAMFLLGATLALGFALGAYMLSSALVRMRQSRLIRVKGLAETKITSNFATWSCTFSYRSDGLETGYQGLQKARAAVIDFLKASQVAEDEMSANPAEISTLYGRDGKGNRTNTIEGYVLSQAISVWSSDVNKIGRVAKTVTDLIKAGLEVKSDTPQFVYTDIESVKLDLIGKATKNAYERAQALAANSNGKVGKLNSASQGVFQITSVNSTETSDYGCYDTHSIGKSVRCVVTLEFAVDK